MRKGLLGNLEEHLVGFFGQKVHPASVPAASPPTAAPPTVAPLDVPVAPELDASLSALQTLSKEIGRRMREGRGETSLVGERIDVQAVLKAAEKPRQQIAEDIVAMHERLGTGLRRAELERLQQDLTPLLPHLEKEQGGIVERTYFHVLTRVLHETAALAWAELTERMEKAGLRWPEPSGTSPSATPEELEAARVRSLEGARRNFLETRPEHVCDRVFGLVRIWRASYPPRGSDLWFQQCLLGVASGRQLQLFEEGAALLLGSEGEEVKARLRQAASDSLAQARLMLQRGTQSLEDVNAMLVSTDRLASKLAPDLVWDWLQPRLSRPTASPLR